MSTLVWANTYCLHTWPVNDLIPHELSPDCVCAPTPEQTEIRGELWFVYVHSSLDQREKDE